MSDEGRASPPLFCFKCPTTAKPPASNFSNVRCGQSLSPQLPNVFGWKDLENGPNNNTSQKLTMHQSIQVIRGGTSSATRRISSSTFKKKRGVKFTLRFSRKAPILPRFSKLCEARSRLYRRRFLQVLTRWKALDEIYKTYILLHRSDLKISAKNRQHFFREWKMNFLYFVIVVSN